MTTGFQAINSSGVVQIDQDTANFALVLKSTGTFTNLTFGSVVIRYCLFTVTGLRNPVLAVQTASGIDFWSGMKANGSGSFSFYVYSAGAAASSTFTYYIFDSADLSTISDRTGMQIFNASGVTVFHSSAKAMRVVGSQTAYSTVTYSSGPTYAVAMSSYENKFDSIDLGGGTISNLNQWSEATVTGNSVALSLNPIESYIGTTLQTSTDHGVPYILVIDVTNY